MPRLQHSGWTARIVLALCLTTASAQAGVIVVDDDGGPGVDFTNLGPALAAAVEGDTIFVRAGHYPSTSPLIIDAVSLQIIGEGPDLVTIELKFSSLTNNQFSVRNISAGQSVTLRGLGILDTGFSIFASSPFVLEDCAGSIWVEDCRFLDLSPTGGTATLLIDNCVAVSMHGCVVDRPGPGTGVSAIRGQGAASAHGSGLFLYDTKLLGGHGGVLGKATLAGGDGLVLTGGSAYASGCTIEGGDGAHGFELVGFSCASARSGGDGIELTSGSEVVRLVETSVSAGTDGLPVPCNPTLPVPAQQFNNPNAATLIETLGSARHLELSSPVVVPSSTTVRVQGPPGEFLFFIISAGHDPLQISNQVALMPLIPVTFVPVAPMPASGRLMFTSPVADVPGGLSDLWVYVQAGFTDALGEAHTSGAAALVILDVGP